MINITRKDWKPVWYWGSQNFEKIMFFLKIIRQNLKIIFNILFLKIIIFILKYSFRYIYIFMFVFLIN